MSTKRLVYTLACAALVAAMGILARTPAPRVMAADEAGAWVRLSDMPVRTQEVAVAEAGGLIYAVGGQTHVGDVVALTSNVWAYDPVGDSWAPRAALPGPPRDHIGLASVGGKLYAFGGLTGWPGPSLPDVYEYSPLTNSWLRRADMPDPRPADALPANPGRGAMGVAVVGGEIYVAGGVSGLASGSVKAVGAFAKYNPATNAWTELPSMPTARDHLVAVAVGGAVHAIGGRDVLVENVTGAHEVFDTATGTWGSREPLPAPRGGMGAGVLGGRVIVFGGEGPNNTGWIWGDTDEYDPAADSWRPLASMGVARHGIGGATYQGAIYVPGGGELAGGGGESLVNERFSFAPTAEPTVQPTAEPTAKPTAKPTATAEVEPALDLGLYLPAIVR